MEINLYLNTFLDFILKYFLEINFFIREIGNTKYKYKYLNTFSFKYNLRHEDIHSTHKDLKRLRFSYVKTGRIAKDRDDSMKYHPVKG